MKVILLVLIFSFIFLYSVSASEVSVWQGQYYIGTSFQTGTYEFNFTIYDSESNGNICFSNSTNLTTGNWGQWRTEQIFGNVCNNASVDYFLNINIEGVDQTPRRRLTVFDYLRRDTDDTLSGDLYVTDTLRGGSPLQLEEVVRFVNATKDHHFSMYYSYPENPYSNVSSDFDNALIFETLVKNPYQMEVCFWDNDEQKMIMCLNEGAPLRATTIRRSFQIVGNKTVKESDENFTLCEGANYVDCSTDATGADLFVHDDIEAQSIYANEDVYAEGSIDSESGIGVPIINAINISADNINADLIQSPLGKFTNITCDKITADLLWIIDIVVDNIEVTDLNTGGNAGDDLCVDSNDMLCRCGSCA